MAYSTTILADSDLRSYWRLGEGSGTNAADSGTNAFDLTYTNSPTLGVASLIPNEPSNTAVTFNGTNQYATGTTADIAGLMDPASSGDGTIEVTFKPLATIGDGNFAPILCNHFTSGVSDSVFEVGIYQTGGSLYFAMRLFSPGVYEFGIYGDTVLSTGTAYHGVYVSDATTTALGYLYVNGTAQTPTGIGSGNSSLWFSSLFGTELTIAAAVNGSPRYTNATVDDIAVYNAVFDSTKVSSRYSEWSSTGSSDIDSDIPVKSFTFTPNAITSDIPGSDIISNIPSNSFTFTPNVITSTVQGPDVDSNIPLHSFTLTVNSIESNDAVIVSEAIGIYESYIQSFVLNIIEQFTVNEAPNIQTIANVIEAFSILESGTASAIFAKTLLENTSLSDSVKFLFIETISNNITITDNSSEFTAFVEQIYEEVSAIDSSVTIGEFSIALASALVISSELNNYNAAVIVEGLAIAETISQLQTTIEEIVETFIASDLAGTQSIYFEIAEEDFNVLFTTTTAGSVYINYLAEDIKVTLSKKNAFAYEAYVMNPENYAVSTYNNFDFSSSCVFNDTHYLGRDAGIFKLEGDFDYPNTYITSVIQTASLDFGTSNKKQVPKVYIGTSNSGKVILKVNVDGQNTSYFQLGLDTDNLDTQMIEVGKGLIGRYFQFELSTKENSELHLDEIEFFPVVFGRKVR